MVLHQMESRQTVGRLWVSKDILIVSPCGLDSVDICHGSLQCACSDVTHFLATACAACITESNPSWDEYAQALNCGNPKEFPTPLPTGIHAIPSWALAMTSETPSPTVSNFAAATSLASFISARSAVLPATPTSAASPSGGQGNSHGISTPTSATGFQQPASSTESGGSITTPTATGSRASVPSTARNAFPSQTLATPTTFHGLPNTPSLASQCHNLDFRRRRFGRRR
ncbi:hypothetical protein B0H11DRAFT_765041 [Mycena galericulata]|nr:hypothetical protein B0H11DRAFT_765041 [Mycena galericulata]